MMTTIDAHADLVTLINVFTVAPDRQEELFQALDKATVDFFTGQQGFISANLHVSEDGTKVVNYAQWASTEAYQQVLQTEAAKQHIAEIMTIAERAEPRLYEVRSTHHQ
ncbi:antibiotic biosynthesis monooxygenase family protein [Actinocrispum sp. NPDC049592]|uniref:antibiotic biosynthesis monooxygenase family protein n=1 Tax=Actinocrispum sp. NPDC049592 TaxID=3154835 RepID=UPI0034301D34